MASRIKQNRLVIQLARECLENKGFRIIERYQDRGTYSRTYTIAERDGSVYLIATTGREEIRADGKLNPEYNLVQKSNDQEQARRLENNKHPDKACFNFPTICCFSAKMWTKQMAANGETFPRHTAMWAL